MKITHQATITASTACLRCKAKITVTVAERGNKYIGPRRLVAAELAEKGWKHGHKGDFCPKCRAIKPPPKPRPASKVDRAEAARLRATGCTLQALGDRYGVSKQRIAQILDAYSSSSAT